MTDDEILKFAEDHDDDLLDCRVIEFARVIEQRVREECAKVCEAQCIPQVTWSGGRARHNIACSRCADAIREKRQ